MVLKIFVGTSSEEGKQKEVYCKTRIKLEKNRLRLMQNRGMKSKINSKIK